jgi:hypothetical protein
MLLYDHFAPGVNATGMAAARDQRSLGVVAAKIEVRRIVGGAAGMGEQVANLDCLPSHDAFGKVLRDRIVERYTALRDEEHHRCRRELLA